MDKLIKVSFVIRTLNEAKTLEEVLRRIQLIQGPYNTEVVIVDSGSTDSTLQIAENYGTKILTIPQEHWSWGRALNLGIGQSSGSVVCLLSGHCFIAQRDFLINSVPLLENAEVAAVYGKQLSIPDVDPFEEYELACWYPDLDYYRMNLDALRKSRAIGISNSCCILNKQAWLDTKFDENVESFEDLDWAFAATNLGYQLVYSNRFSVYHSHVLNLEYTYRKWYWRNYERLKLDSKFLIKFDQKVKRSVKRIFKKLIFKKYLFFKALMEKKHIKVLVNNKYPFINHNHIMTYLKLRNQAILNSFFDFYSGRKSNYWYLEIPKDMEILETDLLEIERCLDKDFNLLPLLN